VPPVPVTVMVSREPTVLEIGINDEIIMLVMV
jgi:hypothetical protein